MDGTSGTITDPVWADIIVASFFVLVAVTLAVLLDSVIRVLVRKAKARRELRQWWADVESRSPIGGGPQ